MAQAGYNVISTSRLQAGFLHLTRTPWARASGAAQTVRARPQKGHCTGVRVFSLVGAETVEEGFVVLLHSDNPFSSLQRRRQRKPFFHLFVPPLAGFLHVCGVGLPDVDDAPL